VKARLSCIPQSTQSKLLAGFSDGLSMANGTADSRPGPVPAFATGAKGDDVNGELGRHPEEARMQDQTGQRPVQFVAQFAHESVSAVWWSGFNPG
jgi:hypothetical protein